MHFVRLSTDADDRYTQAMQLYATAFPPHEQRKAESQVQIMANEAYHFNLIYDETVLVGILLCWETDDFVYVEHFCIDPAMRNRQYGQTALRLLDACGKTVILEIDPPDDAISVRRKGFYERAGYHANSFAHRHPPYHVQYHAHALVVMSSPAPLSEAEYHAFDAFLNNEVMRF